VGEGDDVSAQANEAGENGAGEEEGDGEGGVQGGGDVVGVGGFERFFHGIISGEDYASDGTFTGKDFSGGGLYGGGVRRVEEDRNEVGVDESLFRESGIEGVNAVAVRNKSAGDTLRGFRAGSG
jgi:hypothetical protein